MPNENEENEEKKDQPDLDPQNPADDTLSLASDDELITYAPGTTPSRDIITEMQESYLDYAMSVIVSRALPDVRDGLKPVHRRILYAMQELGLRPGSRYRKSATVVGEVLGKYHPHGDSAVYSSMVRMAQPFSMRYTLVDGQGNFGSVDGDSAAAMRYTEAKMAKITEELLVDIDKDTVDFVDNYDASRQEPKVLPARLPNLLLNGSLGIAVGMATNIPTHNLTEVCNATLKVIENPEVTIEELMTDLPGPDFPTGGIIYDNSSILQAYTTGKGSIVMRAVANIEEKKNGFRILITELPYQVNKADLIMKIADLVKTKKVEGISDIRDESDRTNGIRIVIELKNNAFPKKILNQLFDYTPLQTTFHVNLVALVDGIQPRLLNLKNILDEYIKHRQDVITRRTRFELKKAQDRVHILEGLKIALDQIDAVISTIRESETKEIAHDALMAKFKLSDLQASAILEMRLSALAGLERKKIEDELAEKLALIKELEAILADPQRVLAIIKEDLISIRDNYGDDRKTKIVKMAIGKFSLEDLVPNEQVIVTLTRGNYIKRVNLNSYRSQNRGGKGIIGMETKEEDVVDHLISTYTHNDIYFFTDKGRIFATKVYELPAVARTAKGQALVNIIQLSPDEKVTSLIVLDPQRKNKDEKYFFMTTQKGTVKKTLIEAYKNIRKTGIIAIKLNGDDVLKFVKTTTGEDNILIVTKLGQAIYFKESDVRPMGRSTAGVRGIKLRASDSAISSDIVPASQENNDLLTVLENGYGKRSTIAKHFHTQNRGGSGLRASKVSDKTGSVVEAIVSSGDEGDIVIISRQGQMIRLALKSVKRLGRDTMGVTLMRLKKSDKVSSVALVVEREEDLPVSDKTDNKKVEKAELIVKSDKQDIDIDIEVTDTEKQIQNIEENIEAEVMPAKQSAKKTDKVVEAKAPVKETAKDKLTKPKSKPADTLKDDSTNYWGGESANK